MWILDASVAVKWFFTDETGREQAAKVFERLIEAPDDFAVPRLFFYELAAVVTRKSGHDVKFARDAVAAVHELGIAAVDLGEELVFEAVTLACDRRLSFYDALYAALAKSLKGKWVTSDRKAASRLPDGLFTLLADFL